MNVKDEDPATCEVQTVIGLLNTKNVHLAEIHRQIVEVYGKNAMNEGNVRKWCWLFKEGRTNVHDKEQSGKPSVVTDNLKEKVNAKFQENR
jgi:hypothetical protein